MFNLLLTMTDKH